MALLKSEINIKMGDFQREYTSLKAEIDDAVQRVLNSGWYILGKESEEFEKEFAEYIGTDYAIGVNSGTDALLISMMAMGIGIGDEVITVSHTATATAMAISLSGATPVFVDIDADTYVMDAMRVKEKITPKTRAIIPVHLYGNPVDMGPLIDIADKHGIYIIEDACQAHGADYNGKKVGTFGRLAAFSFYPTKNLGGYGDAGIILTNDVKVYEKAMMLRQYGWRERYNSEMTGINSRLDEIHAAILRVKLKHLDSWNQKRQAIARYYKECLKDTNVVLPKEQPHGTHVYHQFVIRHKDRDDLRKYLAGNGVHAQIHYPLPVHKQTAYISSTMNSGLSVTENICKTILSLPVHPHLTQPEIESVINFIIQYHD